MQAAPRRLQRDRRVVQDAATAALVLALALAAGCRRAAEAPPPGPASERPPTPLVVATGSDFSGPNELLGGHRVDHEVRSQLFLHLLRENPDYQEHPPTFAPELARAWSFS